MPLTPFAGRDAPFSRPLPPLDRWALARSTTRTYTCDEPPVELPVEPPVEPPVEGELHVSASTETPPAANADTRVRRAWPPVGRGQGLLLVASLGVVLGSFLPWVDTVAGRWTGMQGAGVWTFYAGVLGVAGALVSRRRLARAQGLILAATAVGLPLWQTVHLAGVCGWRTCLPSVGLVLVAGSGVMAARATWLLGPRRD